MSSPLRVGLIGCGSMGSVHARVISTSQDSELTWVYDPDSHTASGIAQRYSSKVVVEPNLSIVDALVIAAPTEFHYEYGLIAIEAGKPLLIEKPLTDEIVKTRVLINSAKEKNVPMMCGLLERYNPALITALGIVEEPVNLRSLRHSPYVSRIRTGVGLDLLVHDLDFAVRLFGQSPAAVAGVSSTLHSSSDLSSEDVAECVCLWKQGLISNHSASRLGHNKIRTVSITEINRVIEVDLLRQDVTIYRHVDLDNRDIVDSTYRQQTVIEIPVIKEPGEPLAKQWNQFVRLCNGSIDTEQEVNSILPTHELLDRYYSSVARIQKESALIS
jgi:predicted dehydrogenase